MNPNTEYEIFTQEVYQQLLDADLGKIKTINVQHNVKLKGQSGQEHQIDVYWEYNIKGVTHKVAIECKNYSHTVPIGKVRDFFGVLYDLHDVAGIMVSKEGFQKGAKEFARCYRINLKEIRQPKEGEGIIAEINLCFHCSVRHRLFCVDEKWAKVNRFDLDSYKRKLGYTGIIIDPNKWADAEFIPIQTKDDIIRNSKNQKIGSIKELGDNLSKEYKNGFNREYKFDDAFITTMSGLLKIKAIRIEDEENEQTKVISLDALDFIKAIVKDVFSGKILRVGNI